MLRPLGSLTVDVNLSDHSSSFRPGTLLDFRSQDLAEQLTLLDSELFYKIEVSILPACLICLSPLSVSSVSITCHSPVCLPCLSPLPVSSV